MLSFFLSCTFQELTHKQFKNSFTVITPTFSKESFATFPLWGMMEIKLLFAWAILVVGQLAVGGCHSAGPQQHPSAGGVGHSPQEPVCLQGVAASGWKGSCFGETPSSPTLPLLLYSALVPSLVFHLS